MLHDPFASIPSKDRWSHFYSNKKTVSWLDYILPHTSLKALNPHFVRKGLSKKCKQYAAPRFPKVNEDHTEASDHCLRRWSWRFEWRKSMTTKTRFSRFELVSSRIALAIALSVVGAVFEVRAFDTPSAWVLHQSSNGVASDLADTNCNSRILSAQFLKELLTTTNYPVPARDVQIRNAVVTNVLDLRNTRVLHDVCLMDCRFEQDVKLSRGAFEQGLYFDGSSFARDLAADEIAVKRSLS